MNTTSLLEQIQTHTGIITGSLGPFTLASDPLCLVDTAGTAWEPTFTVRPDGSTQVDLFPIVDGVTWDRDAVIGAVLASTVGPHQMPRRNVSAAPLPVLVTDLVISDMLTVLDRSADTFQKRTLRSALRLIQELTDERDAAVKAGRKAQAIVRSLEAPGESKL